VIACPVCGADRVRAVDAYDDEPEIMAAYCLDCGKNFDVRVAAEGVELAPVIVHGPESAWTGRPDDHREGDPCVLCDVEDLAADDPGGW
jgi:hypothetical protein